MPRIGLIVVTVAFLGLVLFALESRFARNAFYALSYERTLDAYQPIDTTRVAPGLEELPRGKLLSAFYGIDDSLPLLATRVICEGARGKDGMPVIFGHEIDVATAQPGDFRVTLASGAVRPVDCLTFAPADDAGELRTTLLVGQFGGIDDQPVTVDIVGNVLSVDRSHNFLEASVEVTALEDGPRMVLAELVPPPVWTLNQPSTPIPFGGGSGCPLATKQILRVTWAGGVTKPSGAPADDLERALYQVTVQNEDGEKRTVSPAALADLGDGDNNHKLCLDTTEIPISVTFPAGHLTDPRDDLNPDTSIDVTRLTAE